MEWSTSLTTLACLTSCSQKTSTNFIYSLKELSSESAAPLYIACIGTSTEREWFLRNEMWGWHIYNGGLAEHVGDSEVFMCSSLSIRSATSFEIPPCLQLSRFTYTDHHKHSLWPPLGLVAICSTPILCAVH